MDLYYRNIRIMYGIVFHQGKQLNTLYIFTYIAYFTDYCLFE